MRKSDEEAAPWTGPLSCPQQEVLLPLEQTRQLQPGMLYMSSVKFIDSVCFTMNSASGQKIIQYECRNYLLLPQEGKSFG